MVNENKDGKVVKLTPEMMAPGNEQEAEEHATDKVDSEESKEPKISTNEDGEVTLENFSSKDAEKMMKSMEEMMKLMQDQWIASVKELGLKDEHMKALEKWNTDHRKEKPEVLSQEEETKWDYLNGLDSLTDEAIKEIFGEDHPIWGVDHSQTLDRIKGAAQDFFNYLSAMREYKNVHNAYIRLIELEEEAEVEKLRIRMEEETDPEKKKSMQESIDNYYYIKQLGFLADELPRKDRERIVKALTDEKKISYWIDRCMDKLAQLKVSSQFILQISQFEKRFLDEKYHKCSNILLLYFTNMCMVTSMGNPKDIGRAKVISTVMALDSITRNACTDEFKEIVMNNILALENQFIYYIDPNGMPYPIDSYGNPMAGETDHPMDNK